MPASHVALGALAFGAVALLGACSRGDGGTAARSGDPVASTLQEGPVAATAVTVGDCLNGVVLGAAERAEITSADVVSCDRAHGLEVFATFDLSVDDLDVADLAEYPGPVRVVRAADERCADRIEELLEEPDAYGLIALWPSLASWAEGDREVACAVFSPDGSLFESRQL